MFSASLRRPRQGELPWIQRQLSRLEISLTPELHLGSLTNPLNSGKSPQNHTLGRLGGRFSLSFGWWCHGDPRVDGTGENSGNTRSDQDKRMEVMDEAQGNVMEWEKSQNLQVWREI